MGPKIAHPAAADRAIRSGDADKAPPLAWVNTRLRGSGPMAGGPPLYELSPQDARQVLRDVQASVPVDLVPADVAGLVIGS
jgi:hypothetical protein